MDHLEDSAKQLSNVRDVFQSMKDQVFYRQDFLTAEMSGLLSSGILDHMKYLEESRRALEGALGGIRDAALGYVDQFQDALDQVRKFKELNLAADFASSIVKDHHWINELARNAERFQAFANMRFELGFARDMKELMDTVNVPSFPGLDSLPEAHMEIADQADIIFEQLQEEVEARTAKLAEDEMLLIYFAHGSVRVLVSRIQCRPPHFIEVFWADERLGHNSTLVHASAIALTFHVEKKNKDNGPMGFKV